MSLGTELFYNISGDWLPFWNTSQMKVIATLIALPCKYIKRNINSQSSFKYCTSFNYFWMMDLDLNLKLLQVLLRLHLKMLWNAELASYSASQYQLPSRSTAPILQNLQGLSFGISPKKNDKAICIIRSSCLGHLSFNLSYHGLEQYLSITTKHSWSALFSVLVERENILLVSFFHK